MVSRVWKDGNPPPELSEAAGRVLEAALDLFYRQGARATTVRQITSACGLTPGAFYNHFESKEELLYELIRGSHGRLQEKVIEAQNAVRGNPLAELDAIIGVYVELHARSRKSARVSSRDYIVLTGALYEEIVAIRRSLRDRLADVLRTGAEQGIFRLACGGPQAATLAAVALLDMCVQVSEWYHEGHGLDPSELAACYQQFARRMVGVWDQPCDGVPEASSNGRLLPPVSPVSAVADGVPEQNRSHED